MAELFGIGLAKSDGEWEVQGDQTLLNLERSVHQQYRWERGLPLRIEAQYYSGPLFCEPAPPGWLVGNFDYLEIHTPLRHLRTGVIDAWIGTHPDLPEPDDPDLACFHLTRLPTHLVVSARHPLLELGDRISLADVQRFPSLALPAGAFPKVEAILQSLGLWNLPQQMSRYSNHKWEALAESDLVVAYATAFTLPLFKTPMVILPLPIPLVSGDSLVVRRAYVSHPRLLELLDHLRARASVLAQQYPDVMLPSA